MTTIARTFDDISSHEFPTRLLGRSRLGTTFWRSAGVLGAFSARGRPKNLGPKNARLGRLFGVLGSFSGRKMSAWANFLAFWGHSRGDKCALGQTFWRSRVVVGPKNARLGSLFSLKMKATTKTPIINQAGFRLHQRAPEEEEEHAGHPHETGPQSDCVALDQDEGQAAEGAAGLPAHAAGH